MSKDPHNLIGAEADWEKWDKELTVSCPVCGHRCGGHGVLCSKGTHAPTGNPKCHTCLAEAKVARLTAEVERLRELSDALSKDLEGPLHDAAAGMAELRDEINRLWACLDSTHCSVGSLGAEEAIAARDLSALEKALGIEGGK